MFQIDRKLPFAVARQFVAPGAGQGAQVLEIGRCVEFIEPSPDEPCLTVPVCTDQGVLVRTDLFKFLLSEDDIQNVALEWYLPQGFITVYHICSVSALPLAHRLPEAADRYGRHEADAGGSAAVQVVGNRRFCAIQRAISGT